MRFIKRFIFVIILLLIAFFIYRLINPTGAKEMLYDIKSFSNDKLGTHFSLVEEPEIFTGTIVEMTGTVENTGSLDSFSGDELFFGDVSLDENVPATENESTPETTTPCPAMSTVASCPAGQEKYETYTSPECGTYYACREKKTKTTTPKTTTPKTTTPSVNGLSTQDLRDLKNLLQNFQ